MKKVFLEKLPRPNRRISWKKSVGYTLEFVYDDIKGTLKILEYQTKGQILTVEYNKVTTLKESPRF
jgi:hypothetical protein